MATEKYKELQKQQKKLQKELDKINADLIQEGFQNFFQKYPKIESISWKQYAPYFNDGDECIFHIREYETELNGYQIDGYSLDEEELKEMGLTEKQWDKAGEAAMALVGSLDEDLMEDLYGRNSEVCVTREGISVSSYTSHD